MAEEEENAEGGGEEGEGGKKKSPMMLIIIVVVVLLRGGGGAAFFLLGGSEEPKDGGPGLEEEQEVEYGSVELKNIIVNLSEHSSFLKTKLLLEFDPTLLGEEAAAAAEAADAGGTEAPKPPIFKERDPMIKDAIITVLSAKSAEELLTFDGKEQLKEDLVEAINDALGLDEAPIVNIYFIEFIIQ